MVRISKRFTPLWSLFLLFILSSCGKVDTPNIADPFANITGKSLGFDVTPPFFENDASGNQKGLDSAVPGACGNILLQWSSASDDVSLSNNISYYIYQAMTSGSETFSHPTYQVPQGVTQYLVTNLSPGTAYYFVVRASDEAGNLSVIDPNHLVERSATTAGTRLLGPGPNLYCPGGYAGGTAIFTGTSVGNATIAIFSSSSQGNTTANPVSGSEVRAIIPANIQSGTVQLAPSSGTTSDRFFFFPSGLNVSSDPSASTNPSVAVSGTNVGLAWTDAYQGKGRILFSMSADGGGTFPSRIVASGSSRFASTPQITFGPAPSPPIYLVWSDLDAAGNNSDIYFSSSPTSVLSFTTPVNLSQNAGDSLHPRIVSSGTTLSAAWDDNSVLYGLTSVWGSAINDVYAVGKGGRIYHTADLGKSWIKQFSTVPATLNGIWGSGAGDVYAVGTGGTILHTIDQGITWSLTTKTSNTLNGVWGSGISDVYAIGTGGTLLHFDGSFWSQVSGISNALSLNAVWGSSASDVYVAGSGGTILHYTGTGGSVLNGTNWAQTTFPSGVSLNGIWGSSSLDIYIAGDNGTILYSSDRGTNWNSQSTGITNGLNTIWGTSSASNGTIVYAGGSGEKIIKKSGTLPWDATSVAISGTFTVTGLWGLVIPGTSTTPGISYIYGVQGNGPVIQWNGANWQYLKPETTLGEIFFVQSSDGGATFTTPVQVSSASGSNHRASNPDMVLSGNKLTVAWSESETQIVAVGATGAVLSSTFGNTWVVQTPVTTQSLNGVAWSGNQLVAVGGSGTLLTSTDGNTWTAQNSTTGNSLNGVVWSGAQFVAVGTAGTILSSFDGNNWITQTPVNPNLLNGIASSGNQFIAVGAAGTILTSSYGTTWSTIPAVTTQTLNAVVWSGNQFIAVGAAGTILTSSYGTTWTVQTPVTPQSLNGVASSGNQFVAVGTGGTVLTSTYGNTWTAQPSGTPNDLQSIIWDGAQFVAAGKAGTILTSSNGYNWATQASLTSQSLNGIGLSGTHSSIYVSQSSNGGGTFSPPAILPLQNLFHSSNPSMTLDGSANTIYMAWEETSPRFSQIKMVWFPSTGLSTFSPPRLLTNSGTATHPSVAWVGNTLVVVWADALQKKLDQNVLQNELFLISSPDPKTSFTPPVNFSAPFQDASDSPVLVNDGTNIFMTWQQQMPPVGNLPRNAEVFFSKF